MILQRGFTLIELLMVIMVMATLFALLFPIISTVRREASIAATRGLLKRVDNALQLFQTDFGCLPFQDHAQGYPAPNRLAWCLHHTMTAAERALLVADAATASGCYDPSAAGTMVIGIADVDPRAATPRNVHASIANAQARQRAHMAIISGNTGITGLKFGAYDFSATALVPGATSKGMANDFLSGDIAAREVSGDAIIDRWGQPLIYVCPVVAGANGVWLPGSMSVSLTINTFPFVPEYYGMQTHGRTATTALASNILTTAAAPYCFTYELFSAGPDGKTAVQRNDPENSDDITLAPYTKGLQ